MDLENLEIYKIAMSIGEKVYTNVSNWDHFSKRTIGMQLVRSVDSIAANISEGYGRFHFKEVNNFNFYARGSLFETKTWLVKASKRNLISKKDSEELLSGLKNLSVKLNNYIRSIKNSSLKQSIT